MTDPAAHLKLDRILANVATILANQAAAQEADKALIAALSEQSDTLATLTELVSQLAEAMSKETDSKMHETLAEIAALLGVIANSSERTAALVADMPRVVADAAVDAIQVGMETGRVPHE